MSTPPKDCPDCGDTCWVQSTRPDGSPAVTPCPACVPDTPESRPRHKRQERLPLAADPVRLGALFGLPGDVANPATGPPLAKSVKHRQRRTTAPPRNAAPGPDSSLSEVANAAFDKDATSNHTPLFATSDKDAGLIRSRWRGIR